jgi:tight adherence protein C
MFSSFPLASAAPEMCFLLCAAALTAAAVGSLSWILISLITRDMPNRAESWQFDAERRIRLRRGSRIFRWFEPLIDELGDARTIFAFCVVGRVGPSLETGVAGLPWKANEYTSLQAFQGLLVALAAWLAADLVFGAAAATVVAAVAGLVYFGRALRQLQRRARERVARIRARLPFAIDLMALMMEAGAGFRESLWTVVRESKGHPLADEFGRLLHDLERGELLRVGLDRLQQRLNDNDVREMVVAVQRAEELGTPLSETLMGLADQLRRKRSQWAEAAAGRAQANIAFPGFLIMCACLLIVLAPFVIDAGLQAPPIF